MSFFGRLSRTVDDLVLGNMDQTVTVREPVESENAIGETETTYADVEDLKALVNVESGAEITRNNRLQAERSVIVKTPYKAYITTDHRLVWDGRTLKIHALDSPDNTDTILEITCTDVG